MTFQVLGDETWKFGSTLQVHRRIAWYSRDMDPTRFTSTRFGTVEREPGNKASFPYFRPAPIPRELELGSRTVQLLSEADAAVGQLQGLSQVIQDPELLVGPYLRREAVASSRIEGTQASLSDLLQSEASEGEPMSEDVAEVERYLAATRHGYAAIRTLPITQRLIMELHEILLDGVRGRDKLPGELRRSPVWIGAAHDNPDTAVFVPPLPNVLPDSLSDWEDFVNTPGQLPVLIRCGLMHYQFETIHPFLDGNGRIGRLLIALLVEHWGLLKTPLLYLSVAFKRHRQAYYDHLDGVRVDGDWEGWMRFFLDCVTEAADDAVASAQRLHAVTAADRAKVAAHARTTIPAIRLFERLPSHPMVTLPLSIQLLGVSKPTAVKAIAALQAAGVLREITGKRRDRVYAYHEYLRVLSSDT